MQSKIFSKRAQAYLVQMGVNLICLLAWPIGLLWLLFLVISFAKEGTGPIRDWFGLQIVDSNTKLKVSKTTYFFRELIKELSLLFFGIGFIVPLFRADNKGLADLVFNTEVVLKGEE